MGYAIVGYFDKNASEKIKAIWERLAITEVDDYLYHSENDPHFKFAMYDDLDMNNAENKINTIIKRYKRINLHFKKFGFYPNPNKPFITLDIAEKEDIIHLQKEIQEGINDKNNTSISPFFQEGIWKPDIQLTIGIEKHKLPLAMELLNDVELPFDGVLESIGIIEFHPAKQISRFQLSYLNTK